MPTKIRLQRRGRTKRPFYHIVVADGRAPRDGKNIESIGTYNPLTTPATIELDQDKAFQWIRHGAQPTETVRAILRYKGVLHRVHLAKGVDKGALTKEQADEKFAAWMQEKEAKIQGEVEKTTQKEQEEIKKRLEAEAKVNEARAKAIAEKKAKELEAEAAKKAEQAGEAEQGEKVEDREEQKEGAEEPAKEEKEEKEEKQE